MEKIKTFCAIFFAVSICAGYSSCQYNPIQLPDREEVLFEFPQWPPAVYKDTLSPYPELSRWQIIVTCGEYQEKFFTTEQFIGLSVKKNEPLCISATPITLTTEGQETSFFMPAGTIYPCEWEENSTQKLTWEGGFTSFIFETLYNSKKTTGVTTEHMMNFLKRFNWQKMNKTICENHNKETDKFYNPWLIDTYQLLDNLSYGTFKPTFLNMKNVTALSFSKLEPYSHENLLSSYIPENENMNQTGKISVKKGRTHYLSCNTDFAVIILYTSSKNVSLDCLFMPIFIEEI